MTHQIIQDQTLWDSFIKKSSMSTIFHNWDILKIIEKHSDYKFIPLGIYRKEELICIVPFFKNKKGFIKMLFSPPPRSGVPYLGPIFNDEYLNLRQLSKENYIKVTVNELVEISKKFKPDFFQMNLVPDILDTRFFKWEGFEVETKFTYIIDLKEESEVIWSKLDSKIRQKIRKAEKSGLIIKNAHNADQLFEALQKRYLEQKINLPIYSVDYLNDLKKAMPNNFFIHHAELEGRIIGSEILAYTNDKMLDWLGGVKTEDKIPTNEFFIWKSILHSKELSLKKYDLVGANNENISMFKAQFDPTLTTFSIITKSTILGKISKWFYSNLLKRKHI